jgi:hypothetical protein
MTSVLWLRISSVIALLFAAGHTLGGFKYWSPMGENPVLKSMRDVHFDTLGVSRSYLDFYLGFGYSLTVAQVMQGVLLWQIATLARNGVPRLRPMIAVIALANLAGAIIAWRFILPIPAIFALVLLACLTAAYASGK